MLKVKRKKKILRQNSVRYLCNTFNTMFWSKNDKIAPASEFRRACDLNVNLKKQI